MELLSVEDEQKEIDKIYSVLDQNIENAKNQAQILTKKDVGSTHQNRSERDSLLFTYLDTVSKLRSVERQLVFGKLTYKDGTSRYIGRIGLFGENSELVLYDWRTKISEDFYQATALSNNGIVSRRHITLKNRKIVSVDDEIFDNNIKKESILRGENTIMNSLLDKRSSKMNDIVSTIQKEQDQIIRNPTNGVLVVQGAAGTGKTAVALHRAAYLLYNKREVLKNSGILLIGPNDQFLYYIDKVLPSLGETGVISTSIEHLVPSLKISHIENDTAQIIKGDIRMKKVIKNAINMFIRLPNDDIKIPYRGNTLVLTREDIKEAQDYALSQNVKHNEGRQYFGRALIEILVQKFYIARGYEPTDDRENVINKKSLFQEAQVRRTLNFCWMPLEPQRLIKDLFGSESILQQLIHFAGKKDIRKLIREDGQGFSKFDIPLLVVASDLIGSSVVPESSDSDEVKAQKETLQRTLDSIQGDSNSPIDEDLLMELENVNEKNTAINKLEDSEWTFGHIIVDEAQELSQMDWYLLSQKCPSKSFTIVGDVAQTSSPAGSRDWKEAVGSVLTDMFQISKLTVNYRNPQEVANKAMDVLDKNGLKYETITAPRSIENSYRLTKVNSPNEVFEEGAKIAYKLIQEFLDFETLEGRVAIISKSEGLKELKQQIFYWLELDYGKPYVEMIRNQPVSIRQLNIISPEYSKGLEYDAVLLVEPLDLQIYTKNGELTKESLSNLYIAMTRPTQRLEIIHSKELPKGM